MNILIGSEMSHQVDVPEWLSGMTRNHVGFARAGSNPAVHVFSTPFVLFLIYLDLDFMNTTTQI